MAIEFSAEVTILPGFGKERRAAHETSDGPEIRLLLRAYKQLKRYNDIPMVAEIEAYIAGLPTRSISSVEERLALSEKVNANPIT